MTTTTSAMIERLKTMGIRNGRKLAEHVEAPAIIFFFMRDRTTGKDDPRAELRYWAYDDDGDYEETEVFRLPPELAKPGMTVSRIRKNLVDQAKAYAVEELEIPLEVWHGAPFANCWLPRESLNRIREEMGIPLIEEPALH